MSRAAAPDARAARRAAGRAPDALVFLVIVAGVWIAWQILRNALVLTAAPDLALRLGPDAPTVLTRAAEAELAAGRIDTAQRLAQRALTRKPFNVAALRVAGLAAAKEGDLEAADRMLTLAGNWSLRDDPAHSWLVMHRLEQGQAASALAHADTLMRRRTDLRPRYFDLMISLALRNDVQAQGALVALLRREPPWRIDFFIHALERPEGLPVAAAVAVALKDGPGRVTEEEKARLYGTLIAQGRIPVLRDLIVRIEGAARPALSHGDFTDGTGAPPFGWSLPAGAGVLAEIAADPEGGQPALHAVVADMAGRTVAEQLVLLTPGRWRLSGRFRVEQGEPSGRLAWTLACATGDRVLGTAPLSAPAHGAWTGFSTVIDVGPDACGAQRLTLASRVQDRRSMVEIWVDDVALTPVR
ncbi:tetratricopeptide repeat protein [Brevundimonas sp.]|uniref:tetratricopeptide repeat protein n=1 Tax=Brevundimonas sp. TaxID=1871086 RepID=UPI002FD9D92B